jgi:hypothetical protein
VATEIAPKRVPTHEAVATPPPVAAEPSLPKASPSPAQVVTPPQGPPPDEAAPCPEPDPTPPMTQPRHPSLLLWDAGLQFSAPIVPSLAAVATVIFYVTPFDGPQPLWDALPDARHGLLAMLAALVTTGAIWLIYGWFVGRASRADQVLPGVYGELDEHLIKVERQVQVYRAAAKGLEACAACAVADGQRAYARQRLGDPTSGAPAVIDAGWGSGAAYVDLWQRVHRAEEALLAVAPASEVLAEALYDRERLAGSKITNSDQLLKSSAIAIASLDPVTTPAVSGYVDGPSPQAAGTPTSARAVIAEVRRTINEYRDDRSAGFVRLRRRLQMSVVFTGTTGYLLLVWLLIAGVPPVAVLTAAGYYVVGALVGLFKRAHDEVGLGAQIEDFGLSRIRLFHSRLLSGLAAVAGVALVAVVLQPPFGLDLLHAGAAGSPTLLPVFDVRAFPFGVVVAAIFGLTPDLLLSGLKSVGDSLKVDVAALDAAGQPTQ